MTGFEIYITTFVIITSRLCLGLPVALMFRSFTKSYNVFLVFPNELAQSILMGQLTPYPGNHFPLLILYCCYSCSHCFNFLNS